MLLFLEEMKPHSFFFLASHCLFMANTAHPQCSLVSSSLRGCHQPWPVGEWGHVTDRSCECPAERVCLQLTVKPSCKLVHLGHIPLGGLVVCWTPPYPHPHPPRPAWPSQTAYSPCHAALLQSSFLKFPLFKTTT
jgi:hypothetical protein